MAKNIFSSTAPGRVDFLGGVAEASGSWVLALPTKEIAAVSIRLLPKPELRIRAHHGLSAHFPLQPFMDAALLPDGQIRSVLEAEGVPGWATGVVGSVLFCIREKGLKLQGGLAMEVRAGIASDPELGSSTAVTIAALRALSLAGRLRWKHDELAVLAYRVQTQIAGTFCPLSDPLAILHGSAGELLPILCQPDIVAEPISLPRSAAVVTWPSGIHPEDAAARQEHVFTAALMGKKMLEAAAGHEREYLADLAPSSFHRYADVLLPESMTGRDFLKRFGPQDGMAISPRTKYPVRAASQFPVEESMRAQLAVSLLESGTSALPAVGELMLQSHVGYGKMGLGTNETDEMVDAALQIEGIYGARVSGAGAGGSVVLLIDKRALPDLQKIAKSLYFGPKPLPLVA